MILQADARRIPLADESVHCCITSPPFWNLRDYGLGNAGIGLEKTPEEYVANIVEVFREVRRVLHPSGTVFANLGDCYAAREYGKIRQDVNPNEIPMDVWTHLFGVWQRSRPTSLQGDVCDLLSSSMECGSSRCQEGAGEEVLSNTQQGVHDQDRQEESRSPIQDDRRSGREVSVLRGDEQDISLPRSHQGRGTPRIQQGGRRERGVETGNQGRTAEGSLQNSVLELQCSSRALRILSSLEIDLSDIPRKARHFFAITLKPKDLVGIPWRVAFALQADGWWLRSAIVWAKPNPMPESVRDRPTKSYEMLFLLAKQPHYFYDAEAIKESTEYSNTHGRGQKLSPPKEAANADAGHGHRDFVRYTPNSVPSRNRRDVWTIPTAPYRGAHFATFPEKLVEPCILAGTSAKGVCPECGAPWEREIEKHKVPHPNGGHQGYHARGDASGMVDMSANPRFNYRVEITGWRPTCDHGGDWRLVATPTGEVEDVDPTMDTGRAGMNRPRGQNEGRRPMYVWAQRAYAGQLQNSPHRLEMEQEAGSAFEHYIRTDESGARPVPPDLLAHWLENGWLTEPHEPPPPPDPVPAVVLDPFCGSGTVGEVCRLHGRRFIGLDLSMKYLRELALPRAEGTQAAGANDDLPMFHAAARREPLAGLTLAPQEGPGGVAGEGQGGKDL